MLPVPAIALKPSRRLMLWIALVYGLVAMTCLHLPWPAVTRLILAAVVALDGGWRYRNVRRIDGLAALRVDARHQLQVLETGSSSWQSLPVCAPCHLWPGLAIIHVLRNGRRRRYLLEPGMMTREEWRSLRVWMKWRLPELLPARPGVWSRLQAWVSRLRQRGRP